MWRLTTLALIALLCCTPLFAQSTTVSGQLTDAGAQSWNNGTYSFVFVPNPQFPVGPYTWTGGTLNTTISGSLNATGGYSVSIPSNSSISPQGSKWTATFCPQASSPCFTVQNVAITGGTQTVNATPPAILINLQTGVPPISAYSTSEVTGAVIGSQFYLLGTGIQVCSAVSGNNCTTWASASAGVGSPAVGPVINVTNPTIGASTTSLDNATAFAAAATAANNAAYISLGTPTVRAVTQAVAISQTTFTLSVAAQNNDTIIIALIGGPTGVHTVTVSDGTNVYYPLSTPVALTNVAVQFWGTQPAGAKAFTGNVTVTDSSSDFIGGFAAVVFNVGSIGIAGQNANGSSTAPSITLGATHDANNLMMTAIGFFLTTGATASANSGNLQSTFATSSTQNGGALVTNLQTTLGGTPTTSVTLSGSSIWNAVSLELRSVQLAVPTVYFPSGTYNYTSGLNFTNPVTLKGEPGSILCYQGSAHAIDLGPSGLTSSNFQSTYYTVDGLNFQCGGAMTQGIFINNWLLFAQISNNTFLNFGPGGAVYAIFANGNQNDIYVTGNKHIVNDGFSSGFPGTSGTPRGFINASTNSTSTTLRVENNAAVCFSGLFGFVGCNSTFGTSPALIKTFGLTHLITGNNFMGGFCPAIALLNNDVNTKIEANHFESDASSCYMVTFAGTVSGLKIINNYFKSSNSNATLLGPATGTDIIVGAEVSYNHLLGYPLATPVVTLNNLANQTSNYAWHNTCTTSLGGGTALPCPLTHTTGGNIAQWNADYAPKLAFSASTTATYSFSTTYGVTPICTIPPNIPGTATTLTITTLNTTTLTITASASNSATVNAICMPEAQ